MRYNQTQKRELFQHRLALSKPTGALACMLNAPWGFTCNLPSILLEAFHLSLFFLLSLRIQSFVWHKCDKEGNHNCSFFPPKLLAPAQYQKPEALCIYLNFSRAALKARPRGTVQAQIRPNSWLHGIFASA